MPEPAIRSATVRGDEHLAPTRGTRDPLADYDGDAFDAVAA